MLRVSILVEALRTRPRLMVVCAIVAQTLLWLLVPALVYPAPPGRLAELIVIGHEFRIIPAQGPPLANWLAYAAYMASGRDLFGVYLLAQICVATAFYAMFLLGSALVGARHAAMAVLLMVGIAAFTVPTPEFGPPVLALAIWSLMLLHFWWALGEDRRRYWYAVAVEASLLLLTTEVGPMLDALMLGFMLASARGQEALKHPEPWLGSVVIIVFLFPLLIWLGLTSEFFQAIGRRLISEEARSGNVWLWLRMLAILLVAHLGAALLVVLARGWPRPPRTEVPPIRRAPVAPLAARFISFFAVVPALATTAFAVIIGAGEPSIAAAAPLLVMSGLLVVLLAGDEIRLRRQKLIGFTWAGLLLLPAVLTVAAVLALPWSIGVELRVNQPVEEMGAFFAESFERRTGQKLAVVSGDRALAALVALGAPHRVSLYDAENPARTPFLSAEDLARKGAVVVWRASDTLGAPPPALRAAFPDLVADVPQAFSHPVQGLLPLMRVGWGVIRPQGTTAPAASAPMPIAPASPASSAPVASPPAGAVPAPPTPNATGPAPATPVVPAARRAQ